MDKSIFKSTNIEDYLENMGDGYHLRFELGGELENGTTERVTQSVLRAKTLFEDIFSCTDLLCCYIDESGGYGPDFGNYEPNYINGLVSANKPYSTTKEFTDWDCDDNDNTIEVTIKHEVFVLEDKVSNIEYVKILKGIANYEQGFSPAISQDVYFVDIKRAIVFHMYDDRGCLIYSKNKECLSELYVKYNEWLVDYWRPSFDEVFAEK